MTDQTNTTTKLPIHVTGGNHAGPRSQRGAEVYATPGVAVESLLAVESLPHHILEPCGPNDSELVHTLEIHGHRVTAFDLVRDGVDFLKMTELPPGIDAGLTNPPFSLAVDIVRHGLTLVPKFIVLQRIQWLETRKRAALFDTGRLARVYVFSDRVPRMHKEGWTGNKSSPAMVLCWFVFERDHRGDHTLHFLSLPKSGRAA
jgi:hypothetical protein